MVVAMVSVLSVKAQSTAQLPEAQMKSTSAMVSSGSTLPQAAVTGAYVAGTTPGTYSPAFHPGGPRKVIVNPGGEEPGPDEGENSEPWEDPVGDAVWPLLALAAAYAVLRVYRRKRV